MFIVCCCLLSIYFLFVLFTMPLCPFYLFLFILYETGYKKLFLFHVLKPQVFVLRRSLCIFEEWLGKYENKIGTIALWSRVGWCIRELRIKLFLTWQKISLAYPASHHPRILHSSIFHDVVCTWNALLWAFHAHKCSLREG